MKIRALVFEDNDKLRSLISSILLKRGYEGFDFAEPGICPLYLEKDCPSPPDHTCADIIITDINMPNINGLELIENQIRHGCRVKHFAVMSFDWTDKQVEKANELGCHSFEKPFDISELNSWLVECERSIDPNRKLWDWSDSG